jgi:hypothetical protein
VTEPNDAAMSDAELAGPRDDVPPAQQDGRHALEQFAVEVETSYVLADRAPSIAADLRSHRRHVPDDASPDELAALFTEWAYAASADRHLEVRHWPVTLVDADQAADFAEARRRRAQRTNYGLAAVRRLAGNIGQVSVVPARTVRRATPAPGRDDSEPHVIYLAGLIALAHGGPEGGAAGWCVVAVSGPWAVPACAPGRAASALG